MIRLNKNIILFALIITLLISGCSLSRAKEHLGNYLSCIAVGMTITEMETKCLPSTKNNFFYRKSKKFNIMDFSDLKEMCSRPICHPNNLPKLVHIEKNQNLFKTISHFVVLQRPHPFGLLSFSQTIYVFYDDRNQKIIGWLSGGTDAVKLKYNNEKTN